MKLITLSSIVLPTASLTTACLNYHGHYDYDSGSLFGLAYDNGILTCSVSAYYEREAALPIRWTCIDGYSAFESRDFSNFYYDTPSNKGLMVDTLVTYTSSHGVDFEGNAWPKGCTTQGKDWVHGGYKRAVPVGVAAWRSEVVEAVRNARGEEVKGRHAREFKGWERVDTKTVA
jgi:hypothetical protein